MQTILNLTTITTGTGRAGARLSEPSQYSDEWAPTCIPSPAPFSTLFNSKSVELLTGSGAVLVYYVQQWRHHFESERAGDMFASEKCLSSTLLTVHLCGPLYLCGPTHLHGPISLLCGPFTPVQGLSLPRGHPHVPLSHSELHRWSVPTFPSPMWPIMCLVGR